MNSRNDVLADAGALNIHAFWDKGRDNAPASVKRNFDLWERLNPHYQFSVLDRAHADELLRTYGFRPQYLSVQGIADVLRVILLFEKGGVWTDATVLPGRPLDDWLPEYLGVTGFFAFDRPGVNRLISNWFLASTPNHPLVGGWLGLMAEYWSRPRLPLKKCPRLLRKMYDRAPTWGVSRRGGAVLPVYPYFFPHFLFGRLMKERPDFQAIWSQTPKVSAYPPHMIQRAWLALAGYPNGRDVVLPLLDLSPVHKLDWRKQWPEELWQMVQERSCPSVACQK